MRPVGAPVWLPLQSATVRSRPYRDPPHFRVVPACLHGDEPAVLDQNFGRFDRTLPITDGVGAIYTDIPRADGGLGPVVLQPVEQPPRRQGGRQRCWLLRRPPLELNRSKMSLATAVILWFVYRNCRNHILWMLVSISSALISIDLL